MDQQTEIIESFLTDVLPDELLSRVLLWTEFSPAAFVVCRKWQEIMTQETFIRQACFEQWGIDVIINQYEKANEKDKQLMLKEYFIPLKQDGQADWKRYYSMRSNYALALQRFSPFKRSELRKDRIKNAMKFITSSALPIRYDQCLIITRLLCDIGRMCLEQSTYHDLYFDISSMRLFPERENVDNYWRSMEMTDDKTKVSICKTVLEYYDHAVAKCTDDRYSPKRALLGQIVGFFLYSMAFVGKKNQHITYIKNVMSYYLFKDSTHQNEFVAWFKDVYLPTRSTDLAFAFVIDIYRQLLRSNANPVDFRLDTAVRMLFEMICEDKDLLHSPSHLKRVMDLLLASETNVKIDTKFFTTLAELGAPFEAEYMARCTDQFFTVPLSPYDTIACANAMNYLEFVLLKHYPAEAQRVVIDMIEQGKPVLFWILGDSFNLVRQSLGDRWTEFRFRVVDMMLELYPLEVRTMTLNVGQDSVLTGVTLDTVQVKCLNLLMTLPMLYPDETQRQILNVAVSQLYNETNKTELQNKILKMPYMQQPINDNTLPYYIALQALSPNLAISDSLLDDITMKFVDKYFSA